MKGIVQKTGKGGLCARKVLVNAGVNQGGPRFRRLASGFCGIIVLPVFYETVKFAVERQA